MAGQELVAAPAKQGNGERNMCRAKLLITILGLLLLREGSSVLWARPWILYYRQAKGQWRPLTGDFDDASGIVSFTLDPQKIGGGATLILLHKAPGIILEDEEPPRLTGLKIDGRPERLAPVVDLDWLPEPPAFLIIGLADRHNSLDTKALCLELNGRRLAASEYGLATAAGGKILRVMIPVQMCLAGQRPFLTTIRLQAYDSAPLQNAVDFQLKYRHLAQITKDPLLLVDSCYPGYEDVNVLTDGLIMQPGETTFGQTWASAEQPEDHWLVIAWPQPKTMSGLEIYWAVYQGIYHASRKLLVQTWDGQRWRTQQTLVNIRPEPCTRLALTPVTTSRVRLLQPAGEGHPLRPNLMWLTEVRVRLQP